MKTPHWHDFIEDDLGDDTCARPNCGVQVTLEAHMTFSLPCPVSDCSSPKNPDPGCAFAPAGSEPARCLFCGRTGSRDGEVPDTSEIPLDDLRDDFEPEADEDDADTP